METINELREIANTEMAWMEMAPRDFVRIADAIEREIAEKYVLKPDKVSELLNSFLEEYDASMRPDEEIIAKYAAKIREAVSADE